MAKQVIQLGSVANDGTGDQLRTAFTKTNANFTELYTAVATIPTNTNQLTNGSGFITSSALSGYALSSSIPTDVSDLTDTESLLGGGTANLGDFKISSSALGTKALEGDGWGGYSMLLSPNGEGASYISIPNDDSVDNGGFLQIVNYPTDGGGVRIEVNTNYWTFRPDGTVTLPEGGTIAEGIVTDNPTVEITPDNPSVESQKLVIKGGGGYYAEANGIWINLSNITFQTGDTVNAYIGAETYAGQTLYWWIVPEESGISDPGFGTVTLDESGLGNFSFEVDSEDEFTVRVSQVENVYDPTTGVESLTINGDIGDHHLHLTTGDLSETSIFLGTDNHNVRTTTDGTIQITTPTEGTNVWEFGTNGDVTLPDNGGIVFDRNNTSIRVGMGFHIASGEGVSIDAIDQTDPDNLIYKNWYFGTDGSLTFPDATVQTTAYPGITTVAKTGVADLYANDMSFEVTAVDGSGVVTEVTITNTPNPAWQSNGAGTGVTVGDLSFIVQVDGSGNATVSGITSSGGRSIGETFATGGDSFGAEILPTAIDLTKSVNKLTPGYYTLADGVEGQIMYLVRQTGLDTTVEISVAHARNGASEYTDYPHYPFSGGSSQNITMLIFTDGAWQSNNGSWD